MSKVDVELLYGVSGGGELSGASGQEIAKSLRKIVRGLEKSKIPTVKIFFDTKDLETKLKAVKEKIEKTLGSAGNLKNVISIQSPSNTASQTRATKTLTAAQKRQQTMYNNLKKSIEETLKAENQLYKSRTKNSEIYVEETQKQAQAMEELEKKMKRYPLKGSLKSELSGIQGGLAGSNKVTAQKELTSLTDSYGKLVKKSAEFVASMKKQGLSTIEAKEKLKDLETLMAKPLNLTGDATKDLQLLRQEFIRLNTAYTQTTTDLAKSGEFVKTPWQKLLSAIQNKFQSMLSGLLIASAGRALMQIYNHVVSLDKAVTNLQIATGGTREETEKLIKTYSKLAKELGATTTEVADAADTWLRQGYSIAETNELIKNTMMLSKLGQLDSAEAARALTSAIKGYKMEVSDAMSIVDKFTSVDMEAAIGAGDIATAMAETAASADVAGVSMDTLIGYIATVGEITQDGAESVGTFFKTLFARMGNVKAGVFTDDETGEALNDVESVLNSVGISLRNDEGLFRDFSDVLDEVGAKWEEYDNVQQHAIATAFAGTRQQEKFIVLMENYGAAMEYAGIAAESAGTAQEKYQAAYMDSIEAKINKLTATWQSFSANLLDSDIIKFGVDFLASIASLLDKIVQFGDGILIIVPAITIALVALHAMLVKIKTTQTFMTMWTGLKSILAIFPAILASLKAMVLSIKAQMVAHKGATVALAAQTAATHAQAAANTAMNATNPVGWIILAVTAIYALVKAFQSYKSATQKAKEASEEAAEQAKQRLEEAEEAKEQTKEIIDLVEEYKEAIEGIDDASMFSAEIRQKVLAIQQKITAEIGREADGLDLVNDSLEVSLQKLKELKAGTAKTEYEAALGAYTAAQHSTNKAFETNYVDVGGFGDWLVDDFYQFSFERGKDASKYADEIADLMNQLGMSVSADATIGDKFYGVNLNAKDAQDAVNKLNRLLEEMIDRNYASGSQDIYNQFLNIRNKYQEYLDKETSALDGLIDSTVNMKAWEIDATGINIESLTDYDSFRNQIIEAVKANQYIQDSAATIDDITNSVDDWLSLYYADWFNKKVSQYKPQTVTLKSFIGILSELEDEYDALADAMEEMDKQGILSGDTLTKLNEKYPELLEYLKEVGALVEGVDGYTLAADSLDTYLQHIRDEYAQTVEDMKAKHETIKNAFAAGEEGVTQEDVDKSQASVENALANQEKLEAVINTLERSALLEEFTEKLEAQSDALEEQANKYKDILELRQDILQTMQDEAEYQKDLALKQKSVADLQTKLQLAQLDNSASGQSRVRELQEELREAEEELNEFTLEHAIEELTKQIDNEYDEYSDFIDTQVKSIEEAIQNAAQMTSQAIKDAMSGATPIETHHTGGIVGGATLKNNEVFAKLLKGEMVVTPRQMSNFTNRTLPALSASGGSVTYNSPLISIHCDNINQDTLPQLETIVNKAVKQVKDEIDKTMSRSGKKLRDVDKFKI